jgi:peptidoglycan/LPS O-acetylase OafA/YrhL
MLGSRRTPREMGSTASRLVEVEGLRAVAATSILVFHCWLFSSPATLEWNLGPATAFIQPLQSGVTLFFVLSGFLLYRPIVAAVLDGRDLPSAGSYLRNRALRILPAYWVALLLTGFVLAAATTHSATGGLSTGALLDPGTLVRDLSLTQTYGPHSIWTGILPAWSLTIEVAFYLCLPLLALLARAAARRQPTARGRTAAVLAPVIGLFLFGVLGKISVGVFSPGPERAVASDWHSVLARSFLTHADLFAFGMAVTVFLLIRERSVDRISRVFGWSIGRPLAYFGLPTFILGYYFIPAYVFDSVVALLASLLLLKVLLPSARRGRFLTHRWTLGCGRISYSIFLWNYPVLVFLKSHDLLASGNNAGAFLVNLVIAGSLVICLSWLTYRFVEAPALALKKRSGALPRSVPAPSTAGLNP